MHGRNRQLTREGTKIDYTVHGKGDRSVIAIHGFCLSKNSFSGLTPLIDGMKLVTVDLRGHGGSELGDSTKKTYFGDCAKDVRAVMEAEGVTDSVILGSSMGGLVGIRLVEELGGTGVIRLFLECPVLTDPFKNFPDTALSGLLRLAGGNAVAIIAKANGSGELLIDLLAGGIGFNLAFFVTRFGSNFKPSRANLENLWGHLFRVTPKGVVTSYEAMREEAEGIGNRIGVLGVPIFLMGCGTDPFVDWRYLYKRFV
ncbi:alpha/beta hydrolase, partial [Candidatus Micrarchaeota archaeon]|nr:alpha/beta hydrolase [Candidatus Micrarchaeota archaeon]